MRYLPRKLHDTDLKALNPSIDGGGASGAATSFSCSSGLLERPDWCEQDAPVNFITALSVYRLSLKSLRCY